MSLLGFLYRAEKTPPGKGGVVSTGKDEEMFESITGHGRNGKADIPGALCDKPIGVSPKQPGWKMRNSGIELLLITPALAEGMIGYNTNNRPASPGTGDRKNEVEGKRGAVRVGTGGRRHIKTQKNG